VKQYRFVILGKWEQYLSYFLMGSFQGAFLNGALARDVSLDRGNINEIWEQINFFKPHAILAHTIFDRVPHREQLFGLLRKARKFGAKVFYHAGDARPSPRFPQSISDIVDYALINHWPPMKDYSIWKVPCVYWPYMALNQDEMSSPIEIYKCDLAFTGGLAANQHHTPRANFIKQLQNNISVKVFPTPETGNTRFQTPELSASAKAILGFQMGLDVTGYQDVRLWQYCGAGALYFHDTHPVVERFFRSGVHYIGFERDNIQDFIDKYNYYVVNHPEEGNKIRQQAFEHTQKYHSSKERMYQVIRILEGKEPYIWELDSNNSPQKSIIKIK
jgi:hypothetical protein